MRLKIDFQSEDWGDPASAKCYGSTLSWRSWNPAIELKLKEVSMKLPHAHVQPASLAPHPGQISLSGFVAAIWTTGSWN